MSKVRRAVTSQVSSSILVALISAEDTRSSTFPDSTRLAAVSTTFESTKDKSSRSEAGMTVKDVLTEIAPLEGNQFTLFQNPDKSRQTVNVLRGVPAFVSKESLPDSPRLA